MEHEETKTKVLRKRKLKRPKVNEMILSWLMEWRRVAKDKGCKSVHCYDRAIHSLRRYPMPISCGDECKILQGFGDHICKMIDRRLNEAHCGNSIPSTNSTNLKRSYVISNNKVIPLNTSSTQPFHVKIGSIIEEKKRCRTKMGDTRFDNTHVPKVSKPYRPKFESAPQRILQLMFEGTVVQREIVEVCTNRYNLSLKSIKSALSKLMEKFLIHKIGNFSYALTNDGRTVAESYNNKQISKKKELLSSDEINNNKDLILECNTTSEIVTESNKREMISNDCSIIVLDDDDNSKKKSISCVERTGLKNGFETHNFYNKHGEVNLIQSSGRNVVPSCHYELDCKNLEVRAKSRDDSKERYQHHEEPQCVVKPKNVSMEFNSNQVEVLLVVDLGENRHPSQGILLKELERLAVGYTVEKLNVGDFVWVIQSKICGTRGVLNHIVERKTVEDLASSIVDGRFHEQKFRLNDCGIPNRVLLVEGELGKGSFVLPASSVQQAIANTSVVDGFSLAFTQTSVESARYLAAMTAILKNGLPSKFKIKNEVSNSDEFMIFDNFNERSVRRKECTIREMFARSLLQLSGITVEKCAALMKEYPSPITLLRAYETCKNPHKLLQNIRYGINDRRLGPAISNAVYRFFTSEQGRNAITT